jgi:hypothetical protein
MFAFAALLALAACGRGNEGAGGLSADEERELDNAAAMLDDNNVFDVSPDSLAANEADIAAQENGANSSDAEDGR